MPWKKNEELPPKLLEERSNVRCPRGHWHEVEFFWWKGDAKIALPAGICCLYCWTPIVKWREREPLGL